MRSGRSGETHGLDGTGLRFGLVAARFNEEVVDRLLEGALDSLVEHGVDRDDCQVLRVPGGWEVPLALRELAATDRFDGLVSLAVVIRGETPHFDYICSTCSEESAAVSSEFRIPVGFGVLTCDTREQAEARAGGEAGNKGSEAALAALEMARLVDRVRTS